MFFESKVVNDLKDLFHEKFSIFFEKTINAKERLLRLLAAYLNPLHFRSLTRNEQDEVEKLIESLEISPLKKLESKSKEKTPDLVNDMLSNIRAYHSCNSSGAYKVN